LPQIKEDQILGEPIGRNTAPCIAYASFKIARDDPYATVIVTPADHLISEEHKFLADLQLGLRVASEESVIITLGITPTRPDTGYGYIQYIEPADDGDKGYYKVKTFTEKPNREMAQAFLESGDFLWNSGIFIFAVGVMQQAMLEHMNDMYEQFDAVRTQLSTSKEQEAIQSVYSTIRPISIDYGVMEKTDNVYVIRSNFNWSDLGTWNSLYEHMNKDDNGNAATGNVKVFEAKNNIIKSQTDRLIVLRGVEDLILVETANVLFVCPRDEEQKIRDIVSELKQQKGNDVV
jgi:mannose-1-phosphate guanylyltransferase